MIDQQKLHEALTRMGKKHLKPKYKEQWTPERPTTGYCYVVAEIIYHYFAREGSCSYVMKIADNETHWFIKDPDGQVIDLTADQFDEIPNYSLGKKCSFLTKEISKRGRVLAALLDLKEPLR